MSSGLFGITNSNRNEEDHWGKNCFNSSFPTSLACYMLAHDIPAIYVKLEKGKNGLRVVSHKISLREVFNCGSLPLEDLKFDFESVYAPYQKYSYDTIDGIDLVVKEGDLRYLAPLEVKLTVLPTDQTSLKPEAEWGCEVVIRSATTSYCALGMFDSVAKQRDKIRNVFEAECSSIQSWDNDFEMSHKTKGLCKCIDRFQTLFLDMQKPLLMQTIWKTQGKTPLLADQAFDIVIWSDYAFSRLFVDSSSEKAPTKMSRPMRASARLARCLWELSKSGKIRLTDIYRQMAFGTQTDKEFAINGIKWRNYVSSKRIVRPILPKTVLSEVIEEGCIKKLSPERRLDMTLFFTIRNS